MLKVFLQNRQKQKVPPRVLFQNLASFVIQNELEIFSLKHNIRINPSSEFECYIELINKSRMIRLNREIFDKNSTTDVISLSYLSEITSTPLNSFILGEIYISPEEALLRCKDMKTTYQQELLLYLIHGILHIFGYEDESPSKKKEMRTRELFYMKAFASFPDIS